MRIEDIHELHHITRMLNVASIMRRGLLSSEQASAWSTRSFGTVEIGKSRIRAASPAGQPLTHYVHLLVNARGPMWQKHLRRLPMDAINHVIFRVSPEVLHVPGAYVSAWDGKSRGRVYLSPSQALQHLSREAMGAKWWNNDVDAERRLMTQVIVPDRITPELLQGVYVAHRFLVPRIGKIWPGLAVEVNRSAFFADTMQEVQRELQLSERARSGLFELEHRKLDREGNYIRLLNEGRETSQPPIDDEGDDLDGETYWNTNQASTFDYWSDDDIGE